jgi:hypothetical protein
MYVVNFFPEGGNVIGNVKNTIAFKCTDKNGIPKDIEGKILDVTGKEIVSFKSTHNGMGSFSFVPKTGEQYNAECLLASSQKKMQPLPTALAEGVVLNIIRNSGKVFFSLDATTVVNENFVPDYILAVQENLVAFKVAVPKSVKILNGEIPASQLPSGILQLTVFNKENKPLAERLMFINSGDFIPTGDFQKNKVDITRRAKNVFSFNLQDTIAGTFSVSVTDADSEMPQADNIVSRFLLSSDIKGIVFNPAYYFENNDLLRQQQLDLVMITNGWRRYSWNEILSNRFPSMAFKDPSYISLKAQALYPSTGKPLINSDITIFAKTKDNKMEFLSAATDSAGHFSVEGMMFEDTAKLSFQSNFTQNSRVNARIISPSLGGFFYSVKTPLPALLQQTPEEKLMQKYKHDNINNNMARFDGILLDEVKIKAKLKSEREKYEKKYVSARMGGMPVKELDFLTDPTTSTQNIFDYLQSRVNGVRITGGPLNYSVQYRNNMSLLGGPIPMNIFLDEMQVEPGQIATLRIQEVALVRVYGGGGLAGGAGGALAIYTKKGDGNIHDNSKMHTEFLIEGFSPTKEFFSPDYAVNNETNILTDERTTLYWNPYLITNAQNRSISFSFYNSDKAKKFKVVLEGMMEDGKLLHIEKLIE